MILKEEIKDLQAQLMTKIPEQAQTLMKQSLEKLINSNIVDQALKVGQLVPDFTLPNAYGKTVNLKQLLSKGPVVVTFYRGSWCPYCNLTLRALKTVLPEISSRQATLVAISPELPDQSLLTVESEQLEFEVLSDTGNKVAGQFGIVYKLTPELAKLYHEFGISLERSNGDDSGELPLAATFVINSDGIVRFTFVDADYTKRMEPSDIVAVLDGVI